MHTVWAAPTTVPASGLHSGLQRILSINSDAFFLIGEYATVLAILGSIDSLLTSVIADNMTKTKHNPNKELIGQGIGNTVASVFGGIPGAGATIRTVVNIDAGGKTRLSGMIAGIILLIVLLALGPLASKTRRIIVTSDCGDLLFKCLGKIVGGTWHGRVRNSVGGVL